MKSEPTEATTHDRPATLEEVRCATLSAPDSLLQLACMQGSFCETSSDLGGTIRYPAEEFEFFVYLSDRDEDVLN